MQNKGVTPMHRTTTPKITPMKLVHISLSWFIGYRSIIEISLFFMRLYMVWNPPGNLHSSRTWIGSKAVAKAKSLVSHDQSFHLNTNAPMMIPDIRTITYSQQFNHSLLIFFIVCLDWLYHASKEVFMIQLSHNIKDRNHIYVSHQR